MDPPRRNKEIARDLHFFSFIIFGNSNEFECRTTKKGIYFIQYMRCGMLYKICWLA